MISVVSSKVLLMIAKSILNMLEIFKFKPTELQVKVLL